MDFEEFVDKAVQSALKKKVEEEIEDIITEAQLKLGRALRRSADSVALEAFNVFELEKHEHKIIIRVNKKDLEHD